MFSTQKYNINNALDFIIITFHHVGTNHHPTKENYESLPTCNKQGTLTTIKMNALCVWQCWFKTMNLTKLYPSTVLLFKI